MYRLKLFGGIVIEGPYGSVAGRAAQPRQLALLALLATSDPPIGRDKLTGRLWPEEEDRRARRRLSDTLYVLRQELGDEAVLAVGDALELNGTVVGSDLADYEATLESGDLEAAVSLYAGPFLDGFFYSGSGPFERWVDAQRKRLARTCGIALEALAASAEEKGELQDAVGWWRRLVDLDPYSARAVRRLMEALVALGDRPAALRVARAHVQRARAELDAPPDRELVEFVARLRSSDALEASPGGRGVSGERPASAEGEAASGPRVPEKSARGSAPPDATVTEPEAGRAPPEAGRGGSEGPDRRAVAARAAVAVLLLLAAAASLAVLLPSGTGEASRRPGPGSGAYEWPADDLSLAVLPFENETANPQSDYFVRGMADELYMGLARIPNLEVASRASVARLTGDEEISEIARTLGVTHVVDGSVRRTGHRVRIAARLVDAGTGQPLWGATYDRELSPDAVLGVRAEIARHIATALRTRLARVERLRIARPPTGDLAAYDFYLKGREHLDRGDLQSAEALFRNALERDPQLAVARVYLARAYGRRGGSPERAHQSTPSRRSGTIPSAGPWGAPPRSRSAGRGGADVPGEPPQVSRERLVALRARPEPRRAGEVRGGGRKPGRRSRTRGRMQT